MIYFDNAASTPLEPEVAKLISKLISEEYGNPSSIHENGRRSKILIENSRKKIASLLGVSSSEIIFTSGGTEANNHILWNCTLGLKIINYITSRLEHPAVLRTLESISKHFDLSINYVNVDQAGNTDTGHLNDLLANSPRSVVSLMHANNEIGNLLPASQVKKICDKHNAIFHSDTVQTIGKYHMNLRSLGFDYAVASAHKFHGPKGAGFIYAGSGEKINPFITGGMQERNLRAGTENVYGIAGMALALELAMNDIEKNRKYISGLKHRFKKKIQQEFAEIEFYGDNKKEGLYTIVNLRLPTSKSFEMLPVKLDIEGISVSGGSACSSGSNKPSHVISSLGLKPEKPSLRVSFSKFNKPEEIDEFVKTLKKIISD